MRSPHEKCFCVNCEEYLGDGERIPVKMLEPLNGADVGEVVTACRWCADAMIEEGVAGAWT